MGIQVRQLSFAAALAASLAVGVGAQQTEGPRFEGPTQASQLANVAQSTLAYWTPDRMAAAEAMPIPAVPVDVVPGMRVSQPILGPPGYVNGNLPGRAYVEKKVIFPQLQAKMAESQSFGTAPTNPLAGPYGPFQRWAMEGNYLGGYRAIHGKLFFSMGGSNFVCSGTVIYRSAIATAGHCNHDLVDGFATNRLFCPSYYNPTPTGGAPFPTRGCWAVVNSYTASPWVTSGDPDYDYACLIADVTGTVVADKIGNVTGWAGRAFNWTDVPEMEFGYPHAAPFHGNVIMQVAAPEWYNVDFTAGGPVSKVIGSDMTGGSSGGGWFLGWRHPSAEIGDTDGSNATDPTTAGPYINGVNSHKRCAGGSCASPPSASAGVFWQEMTSPSFRSDGADPNDSEDVFTNCISNPNNN